MKFRKWVRRGLWALCWAAWLGAGILLHQQFPRRYESACDPLPVRQDEAVQGFVGGDDCVITELSGSARLDPLKEASRPIRIWDVKTREILYELGAGSDSWAWAFPNGRRILCNFTERDSEAASIFDVETGGWTPIECDPMTERLNGATFHPGRGWIAFLANLEGDPIGRDGSGPWRLIVVDASNGRTVAMLPPPESPAGLLRFSDPAFVPNSDLLIVETKEVKTSTRGFQVVRLPDCDHPVLERRNHGIYVRIFSATGVMVWWGFVVEDHDPIGMIDPRKVPEVNEIIDLSSGRSIAKGVVDRGRSANDPPGFLESPSPARLSSDGRSLLHGNTVWDVESRRILWSAPNLDGYSNVDPIGRISTRESMSERPVIAAWNRWIGGVLPSLSLLEHTHAVRDFRTGRFLHRHAELVSPRDVPLNLFSSPSNQLLIAENGAIYSMEPAVQWKKLALLQGLLALPLVAGHACGFWLSRRRPARPA